MSSTICWDKLVLDATIPPMVARYGAALSSSIAAIDAPAAIAERGQRRPFSGLDTLPALGVVLLSLGVLLEDVLVALVAILLASTGIALELALGAAALHGISSIL